MNQIKTKPENSQEPDQSQPPEIEFPYGIENSVTQLAGLLGLKPWALFQGLLPVVGGAAGNGVKVRTSILPAPINLALSCIICQEGLCPLAQALDFLLQPLRDHQDAQSASLGARARAILEQQLGRLEAAQAASNNCSDPEVLSPDNHSVDLAGIRRSLRTFVLCEDAPAGGLAHAMQYSPDGAAVVVNHGTAVAGLLSAAGNGALSDWRLLCNGFLGRSFNSLFFDAKSGPPLIKPAIASFLIAEPQILAELFASENSVLKEFAAQSICLHSSETTSQDIINPASSAEAFARLGSLLSDLLRHRASDQELVLELSPEAARSLADFHRQQIIRSRSAPRYQQRIIQNASVVAAKLVGSFQLLTPEPTLPISAAVMEKINGMTTTLSTDTARLAELLVGQRQGEEVERTSEKMFRILRETGKIDRWKVWFKFDDHRKEKMLPALERLVRTGRARIHPDGEIEAIRAAND